MTPVPDTKPCVGCGYCCWKVPCPLGVELYEVAAGPCPGLRWDGTRHWCGPVLEEDKGAVYAEHLAIGGGCCSPLNQWRKMRIKDRTDERSRSCAR